MKRFWSRFEGIAGGGLLGFLILVALAAPVLYPGDPQAIIGAPLTPPFAEWALPFGTDRLGRDVFGDGTLKNYGDQGIDTTWVSIPSALSAFCASIARLTSLPDDIRIALGCESAGLST